MVDSVSEALVLVRLEGRREKTANTLSLRLGHTGQHGLRPDAAPCRADTWDVREQAAARARSGSSSIPGALAGLCLREEGDSSAGRDRGLWRGKEMTRLGITRRGCPGSRQATPRYGSLADPGDGDSLITASTPAAQTRLLSLPCTHTQTHFKAFTKQVCSLKQILPPLLA